MTLSSVTAALRADGIEPEVGDDDVRFDRDGWHYTLALDESSKKVDALGAWCEMSLDGALQLVADLAARSHRSHLVQRAVARRRSVGERLAASSPSGCAVRRRTSAATWTPTARVARVSPRRSKRHASRRPRAWFCAPAADGPRGAAVERLRTHLAGRHATLARPVKMLRQTTPDLSIEERPLVELGEHLAEHATMFTHADDWRDALVVGGTTREILDGDPADFGWKVQLASERTNGRLQDLDRRVVRLVEGPFAFGIHRVHHTDHELHAIGDAWPSAAVTPPL